MSRQKNAEIMLPPSSETEMQETVAEQEEQDSVQEQIETDTSSETKVETEEKQEQSIEEKNNQQEEDHPLPFCSSLVDKQILRRVDCIMFISLPKNMTINIYHHNVPSR